MTVIRNPILRGFNPDPSIIRVGADYYIATSTFEWFPGVQIHHSKDLIHWELVHRPLNRTSQLDMIGVPDSGGVWAPCLSYHDGLYYLVFSNVKSFQGVWKDTPNYLVWTDDILGDWSDPVFLNSSGFDGSIFHDDDGKTYYLSMITDHRKGKLFGGIIMQEFDLSAKKLIGPQELVFEGTRLGITEGPHMYKIKNWYYLITAEGGTEYGHAVTIARSKSPWGPFEVHPDNPILSAQNYWNAPLQKIGHADIVETPEGEWFITALVGRPLSQRGRCILGRESAIEKFTWKDGWPVLEQDRPLMRLEVPIDGNQKMGNREAIPPKKGAIEVDYNFDVPEVPKCFQSLRIPQTEDWIQVDASTQQLTLYGQETLSSLHRQSLIAERLTAFESSFETQIDFSPEHYQHLAGMVAYYNSYHWHYCHISANDQGKRVLQILTCDKYATTEVLEYPILLPKSGLVSLRLEWNYKLIQFSYSLDGEHWKPIAYPLDGSILSDDYVMDHPNRYRPAFTGAFVGMACQDLSGQKHPAHFQYWKHSWLDY